MSISFNIPFDDTSNQHNRGNDGAEDAAGIQAFRDKFYGPPPQVLAEQHNAGGAIQNGAEQFVLTSAPAPVQDVQQNPYLMQLERLDEQTRNDVMGWVNELASDSPQVRGQARRNLVNSPEAARSCAFGNALHSPNHPIHRLFDGLASPTAEVRNNAISILRMFEPVARPQIETLLNDPTSPLSQAVSRWISELASDNLQTHNSANQALTRLREIAGPRVDTAITNEVNNPNSPLGRHVRSLIADLASGSDTIRNAARDRLYNIVPPSALPVLETAMRNSGDLEQEIRLETLIRRISEKPMREIIAAITRDGQTMLPSTGNREQDEARGQRFARLVDNIFKANTPGILDVLGEFNPDGTYRAGNPREWQQFATALQYAFRSDPRTSSLIARVSNNGLGNLIIGHDTDSYPGSAAIVINRNGTVSRQIITPQEDNTAPGDGLQQLRRDRAPDPANNEEALRDTFVDPFAASLGVWTPFRPGSPGTPAIPIFMIPATPATPDTPGGWHSYVTRHERYWQQQGRGELFERMAVGAAARAAALAGRQNNMPAGAGGAPGGGANPPAPNPNQPRPNPGQPAP